MEADEESTVLYILSQQSNVAVKLVWILLTCFRGDSFQW